MRSGQRPSNKEQWSLIGRYGTIGIEMGLCVIFGYYGGAWVDGRFDTTPYGTNFGLFAGVAAAFKALWRMYQTIEKERLNEPPGDDPGA